MKIRQSILNRFPVIVEISNNTDSMSSWKWKEWVSYLLSSRAMITAPLISAPAPYNIVPIALSARSFAYPFLSAYIAI